MAQKYHFEHHRREALLNKKRFTVVNAIMVAALVIAGGWVYFSASKAAFNGLDAAMLNVTGNNVVVRPGDRIQYRVGYVNNGPASYNSLFVLDGRIPAYTHIVSQSDGSVNGQQNPYVKSYSVTSFSARWELSGIPASGAPYNAWEGFYYTVEVDANAPSNYSISARAELVKGDGTIQLFSASTSNPTPAPPPPPPPATVSISASSTQITQNSPLTITWSSQNATACNASGTTWSGARAGSGSENRNSDTGAIRTITYTMTCNNSTYGGNSASVNVNVVSAPPQPPPPTPPPSVSVTASPTTVYQYTGLNVSWATQNASSCNASGTTWSGAKIPGNNTENRNADTNIIRTLNYILTCVNSGGSASGSANASVIKSASPSVPAGLRIDSQTASSLRVTWQASSAAQGSSINYYQVRNSGGTPIGTTALTNFVVNSGLQPCRSYSFTVVAVNNQDTVSAPSSSITGSTTGCPPATKPTTAPPAPPQSSAPKPQAGPKPNVTGQTNGATVVIPDTNAPTAPTNLKAKVEDDGSTVRLSWAAAKDDKEVASYQVERSTDKSTWDVLTTKATSTNYADTATTFSIHYFYRVKAIDAAGNAGLFANVDVTTKAFVANTNNSQSTAIVSSDGLVTVKLPSGAVDSQTSCSVVKDASNNDGIKSTKLILAAGPYSFSCKQADGTIVDHFSTVVTVEVSKKSKVFGKYSSIKIYTHDNANNRWMSMISSLNKKTQVISATSSTPLQFAVLGVAKKGIPFSLIVIVVFILILVGLFFSWRVRQQQKVQYNEYIRHKYYDL